MDVRTKCILDFSGANRDDGRRSIRLFYPFGQVPVELYEADMNDLVVKVDVDDALPAWKGRVEIIAMSQDRAMVEILETRCGDLEPSVQIGRAPGLEVAYVAKATQ